MGFSSLAEPLTDLLCKTKEWEWTDNHQKSFEDLKSGLLEGTACAYPDFSKPFILKCDSSGTTVGAVLSQKDERGKECIVSCASQKLNSIEVRWAAIDKEFFAVVWGVRQYRNYLRYAKFFLYTDHEPLLYCLDANTKNDASGKRCRWALELNGYDFEILYKKGAKNTDADALSCHLDPDPPQETDDDNDVFIVGAMCASEGPLGKRMGTMSFYFV